MEIPKKNIDQNFRFPIIIGSNFHYHFDGIAFSVQIFVEQRAKRIHANVQSYIHSIQSIETIEFHSILFERDRRCTERKLNSRKM